MTRRLKITRRDFLNGMALTLGAGLGGNIGASFTEGSSLTPDDLDRLTPYPPALTGLRGSHPGSFEVAHAVSWQRIRQTNTHNRGASRRWPLATSRDDTDYDLVVIGAGISGLAAAHFFRERHGAGAKILLLDNHDDFGGHAKRNEFNVNGTRLLGYGGSQSIDTPMNYSKAAKQLLLDLNIDVQRFYEYFDQEFFARRNMSEGLFFAQGPYATDRLAPNVIPGFSGDLSADVSQAVARYPLTRIDQEALQRLITEPRDYLPDLSRQQKVAFLKTISYTDFLHGYAGIPKTVTDVFRDSIRGYWGVGWDALSAMEGVRLGAPGTQGMGVGERSAETSADFPGREQPYIFHFPDGNASIARALVSSLIPEALPAQSMEDRVIARLKYANLDKADSSVRIRLNATAINLRHITSKRSKAHRVEVTYVKAARSNQVRAQHVIYAGYSAMLPYICNELPARQRKAIQYASKVPLVYINVAVRNWKAFANLGYHHISIPQGKLLDSFGMDFPVSMGAYHYSRNSDQPAVIHGSFVPSLPDSGLPAREQHKAGRRKLYSLSFDDFETDLLEKFDGALGPGGFDVSRDIAAITVNRWPHGYAYEYNELFDPPDWSPQKGPHIAGRAPIGNISIANSDTSAYAYVDGALDAADRAVDEQLMSNRGAMGK